MENKNNTDRIKDGKSFCHFEKWSRTAGKRAQFMGHYLSLKALWR